MRIIEQLISENTGPFRLYVFLIPAKCSEFGGLESESACHVEWDGRTNPTVCD
jgi:predicted metalloprotease with PDZ domain